MIKLNKMTDYGTVLLSVMASYYARDPMRLLSSVELARKSGLTQTTTQKLLKNLVGTDFVAAERGKSGGYRLIRSPHEISIAEIVEALEGPIALTSCVTASLDPCSSRMSCFLGGNWEKINTTISEALQKVSLEDLCHPASLFKENKDGHQDHILSPSHPEVN
jgi:FeS assembly SUF system regulator